MSEVLAVCRNVDRDFFSGSGGHALVLRNVNCEIREGERIALSGPSGSGKTTLLHILGGLDHPTGGQIEWPSLGTVEQLRPRQVGFVFQSPSLFLPLTAAQNVDLPAILAGRDASYDGKDASALLCAFGLGELADKLPEELSGGQAQRVAMVRALALRPRLILADEPTGQLDGTTAQSFVDLVLEHLEGTRAAIVVATHDQAIALRMTTHWTIDRGRLTCGKMNVGA
jgi:putative ABC transport system ATP-binding protein/lipoprotein-releasing system ATP-binding protein